MKPINFVVPAINPSIALIEQHNEAFITSLVIAEQLGVTHEAVLKSIKKHSERLEKHGPIRNIFLLGMKIGGGGRKTRVFLLNEDHAIFLIQMSQNSERVVELKDNITTLFSRFRNNQQTATNYLPAYQIFQRTLLGLAEYADFENRAGLYSMFLMNYNDLVNKACGIQKGQRHAATTEQRAQLVGVTEWMTRAINDGIADAKSCKQIYRDIKTEAVSGSLLTHVDALALEGDAV